MAIELIDKIKQKNGGTFKLVDAIDVELSNGKDVESVINEIVSNGVGGEKELHIGDIPPENTNLLWVSTSDNEIETEITTGVLEELLSILSTMSSKIVELEEKVTFLMSNSSQPPVVIDEVLIDEMNNYICDEFGNYVTW